MAGTTNRFLLINLSDSKFSEYLPDDDHVEKFIGGRGLAVKIFTGRVSPKINPLQPGNSMVFSAGPFTGTNIPASGGYALVTKSPLTNTILYNNFGGFAGVWLKNCGIDGLIIDGRSNKPVYLVIDKNRNCLFKNAESLWGHDPSDVSAQIKAAEGDDVSILTIGIAGENLVGFASIINDVNLVSGRGGAGAVMGSKNLKAIVIRHNPNLVRVNDEQLLNKFISNALDKIKVSPVTGRALPATGTAGLVNIINSLGMLPVNNFTSGYSENATKVSGEALNAKKYFQCETCFNCPVNCGRSILKNKSSEYAPEYDSIWSLGPDCGIFDLDTILYANKICNQYGLDPVSTGATIACSMELQARNILKDDEIKFGNPEILIKLIEQIAKKEGIGTELSEGSKVFSSRYGAVEFSMQVKGLELPGYDPRGAMGQALGYATGNTGGCHLSGFMIPMEILSAPKKVERYNLLGKPDLLVLMQNRIAVEDSLVICRYLGFALSFDYYSRFLAAVSGRKLDVPELLLAGERIFNAERLFNIASGFSKTDDTLPERFIKSPLTDGLSKGHVVDIHRMIEDFYHIRHWDKNGIPSDLRLRELELL